MITLGNLVNTDDLQKMIRDGYISVRHHPKIDLRIYNYTNKTQFDWLWNRTTITCRGLIVDTSNNVIARPWPKFFTIDQYQQLRNSVHNLYGVRYKHMYDGPCEVTEKMDGCMGILYWENGRPAIATRGSFVSHQAELATKIFREKYEDRWREQVGTDRHRTYIFECILPEYRIVVDYQGMRDVVLLGCVNNETGEDEDVDWLDGVVPIRQQYDCFDKFEDVLKDQRENAEGYVVRFKDNGIRVKVKHEDYVRLHRLMTGITKRKVWEVLKDNGGCIHDEFEGIPDELYVWIDNTAAELNTRFKDILVEACNTVDEFHARKLSRKEIAHELKGHPSAKWIFAALDGKLASTTTQESIWQSLKPEAESPWKHNELIGEE